MSSKQPLEFNASWITNFQPNQREIYQRAIDEFADPDVFLVGNSLHDRELQRDLTGFWEIFERIAESNDAARLASPLEAIRRISQTEAAPFETGQ